MAYKETTSVGWFDRLGASFRGLGLGLVMIIAGTWLLWWNEGNFVGTGDALREAQLVTVELGDPTQLDNSKNGRLVHAAGPVETPDILTDPVFGLSINAIRLERSVEFYQWVEESKSETRQKMGGGEETVTTYSYAPAWTSRPVDSTQFKDPQARQDNRNTVLRNLDNFMAQAANVTFGAYRLPDFMINSISGATPLPVTIPEETAAKLNKDLAPAGPPAEPAQDSAAPSEPAATADEPAATPEPARETAANMVHASGSTVLLSATPNAPQIGDVRVTFRETRPGPVSFMAKINGDTFEPYRSGNGHKVYLFDMGTHSLETMYGDAHSANATMTWILRAAGAALVIFGLKTLLAPLSVLFSFIPLLGRLVGAGSSLASALLGLAWSLVVISIAWLRFRPLIGGAMLVAAGVLLALCFRGRAKRRKIQYD